MVKAGSLYEVMHEGTLKALGGGLRGSVQGVFTGAKNTMKGIWSKDAPERLPFKVAATIPAFYGSTNYGSLKGALVGAKAGWNNKDVGEELNKWNQRQQDEWKKHHKNADRSKNRGILKKVLYKGKD